MAEKDLRAGLGRRTRLRSKRTWRCPDETDLAAFVDQHLDAPARSRVERHLADCDFCLDQVASLVLQHAATPVELPEAVVAQARSLADKKKTVAWLPSWRWATVTAAAAVVILVVGLSMRPPELRVSSPAPPPAPVVEQEKLLPPQGTPEQEARRAVRSGRRAVGHPRLLWPREGAVLARENVEFRWDRMGDALFYEVRVATVDGGLVWEMRTEGHRVAVPPAVQLVPGQKYFLWVVAYLPEGRSMRSPAISFRIQSKP